MSVFDSTDEAILRAAVVRGAHLAELQFASGTIRVWPGHGDIRASGEIWRGIGAVGRIGAIEYGPFMPTQNFELSLTAIEGYAPDADDIGGFVRAAADDQATEVRGRSCKIWKAHFNADWTIAGTPKIVRAGLMDRLIPDVDASRAGNNWMVRLNVEPLVTTRHRATWGYLTNRDQQARWPTAAAGAPDRGLERTAVIGGKSNPFW